MIQYYLILAVCSHQKVILMKLFKVIFSIVLISTLVACASKKNFNDEEGVEVIKTLEEHLLGKSGVFIQNSQVRIRGGDQSFFANSEPIFEVDGQILTGGFQEASTLVNPAEIKRVTVLKDPNDLAMYGTRGLNGVIKIKLKNSTETRAY